jgi:glycosyltransferase involved in cell wall biosynthesis
MNMVPTGGPWGGGNQWLRQMVPFLRRHGYAVSFDLRTPVDAIVMIDPRVGGLVTFGPDDIRSYKARHPRVRCLHRINECDKRKGTADMDKRLADANAVADYTVFVSRWLRDYHAERWFDRDRPHMAIYNGADPSVFHPIGGAVFPGTGPLRLVTHHWSNNWNKGFGEYQEVDRLIASGALPDLEFWFIGRAPSAVRWAAARTFDPMPSARVAARLRECHMYLTASQWEPGSMHHVEAAQCGLPVIYHENGGGIVESARTYGVAFRDDVAAAIACARADYPALRRRVLAQAPSGAEMASAYLRIIQRLVAGEPS